MVLKTGKGHAVFLCAVFPQLRRRTDSGRGKQSGRKYDSLKWSER